MIPNSLSQTRRTDTLDKFKESLIDSLYYVRGSAVQSASMLDVYTALAYTVRDALVHNWHATSEAQYEANPKFVYYLSAEYLLGQQLTQNMLYAGAWDMAREAAAEFRISLDDLVALDKEPGLGNGGLGRLAACYLDSLATLDIPAVGYGIRYEYGIFTQTFQEGWQVEQPDDWLFLGNPWEFQQPGRHGGGAFWRAHGTVHGRGRSLSHAVGPRPMTCWASRFTCSCPGTGRAPSI